MANYRGLDGSFALSTNVVGEVKSWNLTADLDLLDTTVMLQYWDTGKTGRARATGTVTANFDYTDTNGQKVMIDAVFQATPNGSISAARFRIDATKYISGNFLITQIQAVAEVGNIVQATYNIRSNGALVMTWS